MELYGVPGVSVAVINDFQLDYVEVHGVESRSTQEPVTDKTRFQAASISKSVSAVGVVKLAQEGMISLDTDVNHYLTSWQVSDNELQNTEKVTLRRLVSHTAGTTVHGFRGYRYTESVPTLIQILNGESPANSAPIVVDFVPGSRWRYSGGGYVVMDQALRDVTGITFPERLCLGVCGLVRWGTAVLRARRCQRWLPMFHGGAPQWRIWSGRHDQQRQRIGSGGSGREADRRERRVAGLLVARFRWGSDGRLERG